MIREPILYIVAIWHLHHNLDCSCRPLYAYSQPFCTPMMMLPTAMPLAWYLCIRGHEAWSWLRINIPSYCSLYWYQVSNPSHCLCRVAPEIFDVGGMGYGVWVQLGYVEDWHRKWFFMCVRSVCTNAEGLGALYLTIENIFPEKWYLSGYLRY